MQGQKSLAQESEVEEMEQRIVGGAGKEAGIGETSVRGQHPPLQLSPFPSVLSLLYVAWPHMKTLIYD